MTVRFKGYNEGAALSYLLGENAYISVATNGANFKVGITGVTCTAAELKSVYGISQVADIGAQVAVPNKADGASGTINVDNVTSDIRTVNGVVYANDAAWNLAYAKQTNYNRIVGTVQNRSCLMGTSKTVVAGASTAVVDGWSNAIAVNPNNSFTSFLVDKGAAFDKARATVTGQPATTIVEGGELVDELKLVKLVADDGVTAVAAGAGNFAVHVQKFLPTITGILP